VSDPAGWLDRMSAQIFAAAPDRISRADVTVMTRTTVHDLPHIQALWPAFETLVGLRGRKMYATVNTAAGTYTTCTPIRDGDDPQALGLEVGVLPGGDYLRGRLVGEPPAVYEQIGPGMAELERLADRDPSRPLVEFYRRRDQVELWVPVLP
jgi:hypothetical protein